MSTPAVMACLNKEGAGVGWGEKGVFLTGDKTLLTFHLGLTWRSACQGIGLIDENNGGDYYILFSNCGNYCTLNH